MRTQRPSAHPHGTGGPLSPTDLEQVCPDVPAGHTRGRAAVLASLTVTALVATGHPAGAAPADTDSMNRAFEQAAEEYDVPRDLLAAVGYGETHLTGTTAAPARRTATA